MARKIRQSGNCLNCGLYVSSNFCGECGQENIDHRVSLRRLLGELGDEVFQFESRLWRTLWTLLRYPGRLTSEYNAGRRVSYTTPLRLYLTASVVYFLLASVLPHHIDKTVIKVEHDPTTTAAADKRPKSEFERKLEERADVIEKDPKAAEQRGAQMLIEWGPRLMAVLLPLFALLTFVFFRRPRLFFVEHLVFALHVHAVAFLLLVVSESARHHVGLLLTPVFLAWLAPAARRVFAQSWLRLAWKLPLLVAVYGAILLVGVSLTFILGMLL